MKIILFDGVCNLCSGAVQWIIKHDKKNVFKFASLQSETGISLAKKYAIPENTDSVILIDEEQVYVKSSAALNIAKYCSGLWPLLFAFIIVPPFIRNTVYDWVARNRYKWFGKKESCWIPTPELKQKFI